MEVPGENNVWKSARFNAYGEERRDVISDYGIEKIPAV